MNGLEKKWADRVSFFHVDVDTDDGQALAERYKVEGLPTIILVGPDGRRRPPLLGSMTAEQLDAALQDLTRPAPSPAPDRPAPAEPTPK